MKHIKNLIFGILALSFLSCVQQTQTKKISFQLKLENPSEVTSVGLRGNLEPLSWKSTMPLTYFEKDNVYRTEIELSTANFDLEFKFVVNDSVFELKNQNNRQIQFKYEPESIVYKAIYNVPEPIELSRNE
ncbi:CBM20 domain-containing protein [Winogradskyella maritima]|uniref:CBM20 domain-containing protein n=1 Tax=Winogradskyella maritima TaxID=1517766 RepID=A0ABV8AHS7_9FLAO|nr:CBM20 domain-containing protein [Winogradskyella maritima]